MQVSLLADWKLNKNSELCVESLKIYKLSTKAARHVTKFVRKISRNSELIVCNIELLRRLSSGTSVTPEKIFFRLLDEKIVFFFIECNSFKIEISNVFSFLSKIF